ncbi:glycoside hydrolase family 15 protein [Oxalobacteraceae bacterium OM1]|nr:glycoside hydrolase family 15 protein [Oxalobacteraceae bacterium OM1]
MHGADDRDAPQGDASRRYPPISDYALISDCQSAALVSRDGAVDWCCMPRFDDDSCFGRLLDWEHGGYCALHPAGDPHGKSRRYVPHTSILETRFEPEGGAVLLYDFFAMPAGDGKPCFDYIRIVEGVQGEVEMLAELVPRFDYGEVNPHIRRAANGALALTGSNKGMLVHADVPLDVIDAHRIEARFRIAEGERRRFVLRFEFPDRIAEAGKRPMPSPADVDACMERTRRWWTDWCARACPPCPLDEQTLRSLTMLKALTYEPTGAIIAAPTTSLPESLGGSRNWDYRYSWIRDSVFVVRVLENMGYTQEADRFRNFIQRSAAGSAEQLQIMYGIDGKRRLSEVELPALEGYRGSRPVRVGNRASKQRQADIYGELILMAWQWHASGHVTGDDDWAFLCSVVNTACERWKEPDHGIWEMRSDPRHFVHSKAMCWAAMERGIRMACDMGKAVPLEQWRAARDEIRNAIETQGYDADRGVFVQAFGEPHLDAALLLLPRIGFVDVRDPRMVRTTDAIRQELLRDGLVQRYRSPDGIPESEGTFLPCTFWLAACLAGQGRMDDAWACYRRATACANDVGLLSEEYDVDDGVMLGNFPQALTHVSQIAAWLALHGVH